MTTRSLAGMIGIFGCAAVLLGGCEGDGGSDSVENSPEADALVSVLEDILSIPTTPSLNNDALGSTVWGQIYTNGIFWTYENAPMQYISGATITGERFQSSELYGVDTFSHTITFGAAATLAENTLGGSLSLTGGKGGQDLLAAAMQCTSSDLTINQKSYSCDVSYQRNAERVTCTGTLNGAPMTFSKKPSSEDLLLP